MSGKASDVVASAVVGARYLIFLQILSRVITFVLNTLIIIKLDPAVFGVYSIQYHLLISIILFLTREAFRRACQRTDVNVSDAASKKRLSKVVNLAWMSVPLGLLVTAGTVMLFIYRSSEQEKSIAHYEDGVYLFAVGALLELLAEPQYILAQNFLQYKLRVAVEASAVFLRCIATYYFIVHQKMELLGFGYAQVLNGTIIFAGYYGYFLYCIKTSSNEKSTIPLRSVGQILPDLSSIGRDYFDSSLVGLWRVYMFQSVEKLVLTEGEKFVLWSQESLVNQGIYSVVNNLGSLVVRFLFHPIEEICFSLFSKLLSEPVVKPENLQASRNILTVLTKFMVLVGSVFIFLGPNFSRLLLDLLYHEKFHDTNAHVVLSCYCVYVAIVAINGITEAFVHAVATPAQLRRFNLYLLIFSVLYVTAAVVLVNQFHTSGLIIANCFNMGLRVASSLYFITSYFKTANQRENLSAWSFMPSRSVMAALVASSAITYNTQSLSRPVHAASGVVCGVLCLSALYVSDKAFCVELGKLISQRKGKKD